MSLTLTPLSPTLPGYVAYTPTWTSSGTAPAIGNSVVTARYSQVGKIVHCYGSIVFGSSATFGTGTYSFALPVAANAALIVTGVPCGVGHMADASAGAFQICAMNAAVVGSASKVGGIFGATYGGLITNVAQTTPWTWAVSDQFGWNVTYEAA